MPMVKIPREEEYCFKCRRGWLKADWKVEELFWEEVFPEQRHHQHHRAGRMTQPSSVQRAEAKPSDYLNATNLDWSTTRFKAHVRGKGMAPRNSPTFDPVLPPLLGH